MSLTHQKRNSPISVDTTEQFWFEIHVIEAGKTVSMRYTEGYNEEVEA
jgi:hypothetical protein